MKIVLSFRTKPQRREKSLSQSPTAKGLCATAEALATRGRRARGSLEMTVKPPISNIS